MLTARQINSLAQPLDLKYVDPADEFYSLLTNRNFHFVSGKAQKKIRQLKILVAGCGSGGGACIEPLVRLGIANLRMAEPDGYELTNMNRQRAYLPDIGRNKADFQLERVNQINPYGNFSTETDGITPENVEELVSWADVVLDCVDVTSKQAIAMKIKLHETAKRYSRPTISPLDVGFCQTGLIYDYRKSSEKTLGGAIDRIGAIKHPVKKLFAFFPISRVPVHSLKLIEDALKKRPVPISQIGSASDLLSSTVCATIVRFAETGTLPQKWHIDTSHLAQRPMTRLKQKLFEPFQRLRLHWVMRRTL